LLDPGEGNQEIPGGDVYIEKGLSSDEEDELYGHETEDAGCLAVSGARVLDGPVRILNSGKVYHEQGMHHGAWFEAISKTLKHITHIFGQISYIPTVKGLRRVHSFRETYRNVGYERGFHPVFTRRQTHKE
jgi:hypothetical protein